MTNLNTVMLPNWLTRCAENYAQRPAVQYEHTRWTFAELHQAASSMACRLATLGVSEGSRVALLASNSLDFAAFVHALTYLGAILVPLNTRLTLEELRWQLRDVKAELLVCDADFAPLMHDIAQAIPDLPHSTFDALKALPAKDIPLRALIDLQATQVIMYTSGTTGQPKGALITYGMQWWSAIGSMLNLGLDPADIWLACLPFFHIGGLSILMRSVIYGMGVYVQKRFDASALNRAIREEGITMISVVAVMLQRMQAELESSGQSYPPVLRCVLLGGGPAPLPLLEASAARNIPVVQTYGLTESCSQAVTLSPSDALRKPGSAGKPLAAVQLRIMHEGRVAHVNEAGEIWLKGPTITPGYDGRPETTSKAFHDGWFATGDLGYLDEEGYLYVLDRRADLIISGGENVYPAEIEAALLSHPAVEEAGVRGQPDAQWGQVPVAFVRLRAGYDVGEEELLNHVATRLARYKQPRSIYQVKEPLPRNSSGKLLRRELPES